MDTIHLFIIVILMLAAFTESLSGFGSALVAMALLPLLMSVQEAVPLVALVSLAVEVVLLIYYRSALNLQAIRRLVSAAILGTPLGILFLRGVDEKIVLAGLGIVLVTYAIYSLLRLRLPAFASPRWGWLFGFIAGILGGAYNTSGPPVVIYGQSQNWNPGEFKGNLQGFFLVNSFVVVVGHALGNNITPSTLQTFAFSVPALAIGIAAGLWLDRFIDPLRFRQIVQVLLIVLGLRLIFA